MATTVINENNAGLIHGLLSFVGRLGNSDEMLEEIEGNEGREAALAMRDEVNDPITR